MEFLNDPKFGGVSPNGCESNGNCDFCYNTVCYGCEEGPNNMGGVS